jgi:hypothetical protein
MNISLDIKVASILSRRIFSGVRPSLRFAVIGGCQAFGIAYGLRLLRPDAVVDAFTVAPNCLTSLEFMTRVLKTYDFAFCADFGAGFLRGGDSRALIAASAARGFPTVVFAGYHPDFIYLDPTGPLRNVKGPMGAYHSALTAYGFLSGLTPEQNLALFVPRVFERLGYLSLWDSSRENLLGWGREAGLDLAPALLRWARRGCFMHTINHPRAYVLFDMAQVLLRSVGLQGSDIDFDDFALDPLASDVVLPVYEPIAEHLGIRGSYYFRTSHPVRGGKCVLTLREFIAHSYEAYAKLPRKQISNPRIRSIMGDRELSDELQALASAKERRVHAASI